MFDEIDSSFLALCKQKMRENRDPAHDWGHVVYVAKTAQIIAKHMGLQELPLMLAAISHDTYSGIDRENHHLLSGKFVREVLPKGPHSKWSEVVALCCEQHRASYKGGYTHIYAEAFASADRGYITMDSIETILYRSYQFGLGKGLSVEEAIAAAVTHMPEKYGHEGYARWPSVYQSVFTKELHNLKTEADNMTLTRATRIIEGFQ